MRSKDADSLPLGGSHLRQVQAYILDHTRRITRVEKKLSSAATVRTGLPPLPNDGQVIYYQSAAMAADGVVWQFRYNADSVSTYKWEFIGGGALEDNIGVGAAFETTTSTSYTDLATTGPTITVPLAGDYLVKTWANSVSSVAGNVTQLAVKIGAAATADASAGILGANANSASQAGTAILTAAALDDLKMQYKVSAGTGSWRNRRMTITPIRVG